MAETQTEEPQAYEFRNPRYDSADGSAIYVEINHPTLGWIPFTAHADDVVPEAKATYDAIVSAGGIAPYAAPAVAVDQVLAERARRLALGFDYDFKDARGVHHIGTTAQDMAGWDEVTQYANALLATGDTTTTIAIKTATGAAAVTAPEWQQILLASAQFRQPIWLASFALQVMSPIPQDYTSDQYWS